MPTSSRWQRPTRENKRKPNEIPREEPKRRIRKEPQISHRDRKRQPWNIASRYAVTRESSYTQVPPKTSLWLNLLHNIYNNHQYSKHSTFAILPGDPNFALHHLQLLMISWIGLQPPPQPRPQPIPVNPTRPQNSGQPMGTKLPWETNNKQ